MGSHEVVISEIDILKGARALIEDPEKWTQGALALNAKGLSVASMSGSAVRWCAQGAIDRVCLTHRRRIVPGGVWHALQSASRAEGFQGLVEANDRGTHDQVLAIFDSAIVTMERRESYGYG